MFLLFMPWGLISGFLAVNALLTFIMVPYASDPVLGVSYRGKGDACFIKALFSPGIVLYPCIIQKKILSEVLLHKDKRMKTPLKCQYLFNMYTTWLSVLRWKTHDDWKIWPILPPWHFHVDLAQQVYSSHRLYLICNIFTHIKRHRSIKKKSVYLLKRHKFHISI